MSGFQSSSLFGVVGDSLPFGTEEFEDEGGVKVGGGEVRERVSSSFRVCFLLDLVKCEATTYTTSATTSTPATVTQSSIYRNRQGERKLGIYG